MKKLLLTAALAAGFATSAFAAPTYLIDDFSTGPNPFFAFLDGQNNAFLPGVEVTTVTDGPDAYNFGGFNYIRTLTVSIVQDNNTHPTGFASISTGGGELLIANAPDVNTTMALGYDISEVAAVLGNTNSVVFNVTFNDGDGASFKAFINGNLFGTFTGSACDIPGCSGGPVTASFTLLGASLNGGGNTGDDILSFTLNGPAGHDFGISAINVTVPEPGALGLLGLGLAGLGFAARRRG